MRAILKSIIQQGWRTSNSGVAPKVGEKSVAVVALNVGENAASHLAALQAPVCESYLLVIDMPWITNYITHLTSFLFLLWFRVGFPILLLSFFFLVDPVFISDWTALLSARPFSSHISRRPYSRSAKLAAVLGLTCLS